MSPQNYANRPDDKRVKRPSTTAAMKMIREMGFSTASKHVSMVIHPPSTREQAAIMLGIRDTLNEVIETQTGYCRLCNQAFHGTLSQVLQQLGKHGDARHPEVFNHEA